MELLWLDGLFPSDIPSELGKGTQSREIRGLGQDLAALLGVMVLGALLVVMEHPTLLKSSQRA